MSGITMAWYFIRQKCSQAALRPEQLCNAWGSASSCGADHSGTGIFAPPPQRWLLGLLGMLLSFTLFFFRYLVY